MPLNRHITGALVAVFAASAVSCSSSSSGSSVPDNGIDSACVLPDTGLPTDVFCTGLYLHRDSSQYVAAVMPYTPGVVLWSDGAEKHRYLLLPPGTQIDTSDMDAWKFPVGTKVWKEFKVDGVLVETRHLWKRSDTTWEVGTYIWNDGATAGTLNTQAPKGVFLPSGYEIPTRKDCDKCHHGGSDQVLGVEAVALSLPTAEGVTLTSLVQKNLLSVPPPVTTATLPEDATGKGGVALGYLHANCGMPCHSKRGIGDETNLVMRLRAPEVLGAAPVPLTTTDAWNAMVNKAPTTGAVAQAFPSTNRITPGAHDKSLVWMLPHVRTKYQMPPLVSHKVDDVGTKALADWIDALK